MSIKVQSLVWEHFPHGEGQLLLMLCLADFADDEGRNVYPAQATMAAKIRMTDRGVRKILRLLEDEMWIIRTTVGHIGRSQTVAYRLNIDKLKKAELCSGYVEPSEKVELSSGFKDEKVEPSSGLTDEKPELESTKAGTLKQKSRNPSSDDPSLNHHKKSCSSSRQKIGFDFAAKKFVNVECMIAEWKETYPNLDILQELREARNYLLTTTKNYTNYGRFLNGWFKRTIRYEKSVKPAVSADPVSPFARSNGV